MPNRDDFIVATSNKQLNFVQHVLSILKPGGRAAMVLPDNVLFEEHAGRDVRQLLMADCCLHTIHRLPVGTFTPYSAGVKANVLFFDNGWKTDDVWVYDLRTNVEKVTKRKPLTDAYFGDFSLAYHEKPRRQSERFKRFIRDEIAARDGNLDIFWLKDESFDDADDLPEPEDLVADALTHLETALDALNELAAELGARVAKELYELPEGWRWETLAEVARIGSTQLHPKREPECRFNDVALENVEPGTGRLVGFSPTPGSEIASNKSSAS